MLETIDVTASNTMNRYSNDIALERGTNVYAPPKVLRRPKAKTKDGILTLMLGRYARLTILIFVTILSVSFTKYLDAVKIDAGYKLVESKREVVELKQKNANLIVEVAKLKSLERIQPIAEKELGMTFPTMVIHSNTKPAAQEDKNINAI